MCLIVSMCPQVSFITSALHNWLNIAADALLPCGKAAAVYMSVSCTPCNEWVDITWSQSDNVPFVGGSLNNVTFISCVTFGVAAAQWRTKGAPSLQEALIIPLRDNNCIYHLRCSFSEGLLIKYREGLENQFWVSQINLQPSSHLFPWDSRQQKHFTDVENAAELICFAHLPYLMTNANVSLDRRISMYLCGICAAVMTFHFVSFKGGRDM